MLFHDYEEHKSVSSCVYGNKVGLVLVWKWIRWGKWHIDALLFG